MQHGTCLLQLLWAVSCRRILVLPYMWHVSDTCVHVAGRCRTCPATCSRNGPSPTPATWRWQPAGVEGAYPGSSSIMGIGAEYAYPTWSETLDLGPWNRRRQSLWESYTCIFMGGRRLRVKNIERTSGVGAKICALCINTHVYVIRNKYLQTYYYRVCA